MNTHYIYTLYIHYSYGYTLKDILFGFTFLVCADVIELNGTCGLLTKIVSFSHLLTFEDYRLNTTLGDTLGDNVYV